MSYPYCISSRRHITGILCAGRMLEFIFMEKFVVHLAAVRSSLSMGKAQRIQLLSTYSCHFITI